MHKVTPDGKHPRKPSGKVITIPLDEPDMSDEERGEPAAFWYGHTWGPLRMQVAFSNGDGELQIGFPGTPEPAIRIPVTRAVIQEMAKELSWLAGEVDQASGVNED
jgi:hypothetical protein